MSREAQSGSLAAAVWQTAQALRSDMTEFLAALVALESPSLDAGRQGPVFDLVAEALEAMGMICRRRSGRRSGGMLLARPARRRGAPLQLLLGHCDTVWPVGTLARMPVRVDGDRMSGPGVYDMKGGVTQTVYALLILHRLGLSPPVVPLVLLNSDEELGSDDSIRYIRSLAAISDRAYVMEPSLTPAGKLKTARKGVAQYRVVVHGVAAHAGLDPERGVSAILEMARLTEQLFALNDPVAGVSVNVGTVAGGSRPNVIAPESRADVDVRVPTRAAAERVDAAIRALRPSRPDASIDIERVRFRAPMEPTPDSRLLWTAARGNAAALGIELEEGCAGGGSDGNITCELCPTLDGLGAVGDGAHAEHEFVELACMVERTALLALMIMEPPVAQLRAHPATVTEPGLGAPDCV